MKVNTTTETVIKLADGLDAGRGVMGPSPLAAVLRALAGERDAAVAIVERLPKTADGVVIIPELDVVYHPGYGDQGDICRNGEVEWQATFYDIRDDGGTLRSYPVNECYSTLAAAGANP